MKTNKLNLRSIRMKKGSPQNPAASVVSFTSADPYRWIVEEDVDDDGSIDYSFTRSDYKNNLGLKVSTKYYIRFLRVDSDSLNGDDKYTEYFLTVVAFYLYKNRYPLTLPSGVDYTSKNFFVNNYYQNDKITHDVKGFELWNVDKTTRIHIYPTP